MTDHASSLGALTSDSPPVLPSGATQGDADTEGWANTETASHSKRTPVEAVEAGINDARYKRAEKKLVSISVYWWLLQRWKSEYRSQRCCYQPWQVPQRLRLLRNIRFMTSALLKLETPRRRVSACRMQELPSAARSEVVEARRLPGRSMAG